MNSYLWAILAALIWGCAPVIEKLGLSKIDPNAGVFFRTLGVVAGIPILVYFNRTAIRSSLTNLHPELIFLMVGGFLASIVGQLFFYNALKFGEASKTVPLGATYPLVSFILAFFLLGEKFTLAKLSGIIFVLLGAFLLK